MRKTNEDIRTYNELITAFKEPKSIPSYFKEMGLSSSGALNGKMKKLVNEGFMEIVGTEIHPKFSHQVFVYKSLADQYAEVTQPKPFDYESSWLNKMFGVNKFDPAAGRLIKEKNIPQKLKKAPKTFVAGSTLSMAI